MKPDRKKFPDVASAWDEYGHMVKWEDLFDCKVGLHPYIVLAWMEPDGTVNYADMAKGDGWEMQNDCHESIPLKVWKKAKIVADCDWLDIKD